MSVGGGNGGNVIGGTGEIDGGNVGGGTGDFVGNFVGTVSYTHLTLPTKDGG